jgi:imidazolonepropionase-like amidohydrolase
MDDPHKGRDAAYICPMSAFRFWVQLGGVLLPIYVYAQGRSVYRSQGLTEGQPSRIALTGVSAWLGPGKVVSPATILIQQGRVVAVGESARVRIPAGYAIRRYPTRVWVYPAFIEPWANMGLRQRSEGSRGFPQYEPTRAPFVYPNDAVWLDYSADTAFRYDAERAATLRQMGFAVAHTAPKLGILRGTGATFLLIDRRREDQKLLPAPPILHGGFDKGALAQDYPSSLMGAIALARQVLYDYLWYRQRPPDAAPNIALERLMTLWKDTLRWCWVAEAPEDAFRVANLMREWQQGGPLQWALRATGYEWEWTPFLPREGTYILPVTLPTLPPVHSPTFYADLPLQALKRWETAPFRLKWLLQEGYHLLLTSYGAPDPETFWKHLRTLIRTGVSPDTVLQLLTRANADWLGLKDLGTIAPNAYANLIVFSDTFYTENAQLLETWVAGERYELQPVPPQLLAGIYVLQTSLPHPLSQWKWSFPGTYPPVEAKLIRDTDTVAVKVSYQSAFGWYEGRFPSRVVQGNFHIHLAAPDSGVLTFLPLEGESRVFGFSRVSLPQAPPPKKAPPSLSEDSLISRRTYPNGLWGYEALPPVEVVLIRRATVWTGDSVLPETDVLLSGGKVQAVGRGLTPPAGAAVIDAAGGALTAGIIDEHSHIAITGGVNEATEAITAEVRIRDVIEPTDVNIYRHLAAGVTTVQLLHGSANPIGGQSACIRLRWGWPADSFVIPDAPPFNKFALGENVKQSNWGEAYTIRYPQSRMGVKEIIEDAFERARRYQAEWDAYQKALSAYRRGPRPIAPRRDLRLEALSEILQRKRFITCHAYVQSEILMLIRLAESFGFRVRTFTHVLEGYKVAPELKAHGAFASTFSDWWAYKMEVIEAIPHNAALLLSKGVKVCINSDDAEMARRLNQEAAKILRYGGRELGIDSIEVWRTVTVYPAQALGIAHNRGYVKPGYMADVVLWDKPTPLSVYSQVRMTFVEGRRFFDRERDKARWEKQAELKARLVEKAWKAAQDEQKGMPLLIRRSVLWHCEDLGRAERDE